MSAPSPYPNARCTPAETKEDCRDYLRTGRCKYGASCKYNHPANVGVGGGMKTPLDPSEPMFPVRPNEPVCQYYMKHGTCKFGQACKFHHPPQVFPSSANGNSIPNGMGRKNDSHQVLWNGASGESNIQMLPQRPEEPNCIFFLKNGRCKYGATCRYHHPLNYNDRRGLPTVDDGRRQHIQVPGDSIPKVHYVTSLPAGSYQQGHFVVADGTVAFLSLDGSTPAQVISVPQGSKEAVVYTSGAPPGSRPLVLSRDVPTSSSNVSIASSYETANSHADMIGPHGDSSTPMWNRPKRSGSGNSLSAYSMPDGGARQHMVHGGRTVLVQNIGDGSMNLPRVGSTSSAASENGNVYYDTSQNSSRHPAAHMQSAGPGSSWRGRRANSFDHNGPNSSFLREDDVYEGTINGRVHETQRTPMARSRHATNGRRRPQAVGEVDDGLSMMTSALLTMLDTPEEAAGEQYDGYYDEQSIPSSQMSTPQIHPEYPLMKGNNESPPTTLEDDRLYQDGQYPPANSYYDSGVTDDRVLGFMPGHQNRIDSQYATNEHQPNRQGESSRKFPDWQNAGAYGRPLQESAQSMSVVQSQSSSHSPHGTNVGLYLP